MLSIVLFLLFITPAVYADTLDLINGKKMEGTFTGRDGDTIKFTVDGINMAFQAKDVINVSIGPIAVAVKKTVNSEACQKSS